MTEKDKELQVQEQELAQTDGTEQMRPGVTFVPRSDIYETDEDVVVILDMPGVSEETIDVTLEKGILSISASTTLKAPEGYTLAFAEYETGNYERRFRLTDQINRDDIKATYKDGVLNLTLPKAEEVKVRKISVKTG